MYIVRHDVIYIEAKSILYVIRLYGRFANNEIKWG